MYKKIKNYVKNEAILKGSITLIVYTAILYFCSYLYQSYTGRVLGPENYSIIGVFFSLLAILLVTSTTLQMSITKFVSEFKARKEYGKIKYLLVNAYKKVFFYGILAFLLFILVSPLITKFFKISFIPILLLGLLTVIYLMLSISRGTLQGLQEFKKFGINFSIEGFGRILFAILLVSLGFGVNGALFALILSALVSFLFVLYDLKSVFKYKSEKFETKQVYTYSWPVFFTFLFLALMLYWDILLVKHFFDSANAGYYAALSTIGKIIFFATNPIMQAMFPITSEAKAMTKDKKSVLNILYKSLGITLLICFVSTLAYFLFSKLIILILFGKDYLSMASLLGFYAVFMTFYSLNYLLASYNLSLHKTNITPLIVFGLFNLLEVLAIWIDHSTLLQIVYYLIITNLLLFIYLLLYTKYSK